MNAAEKRPVEQLTKAEVKRRKRFASDRTVYAYRKHGSLVITDNLLLLPRDSEIGHCGFLRSQFSKLGIDTLTKYYKDFDLVCIGHFNVSSLKYIPCVERTCIKFNELIDTLGKVS